MSLNNLFSLILKGGSGSGNFGHGGIEGHRGGSSSKGGGNGGISLEKVLDNAKKEFDYNGAVIYGGDGGTSIVDGIELVRGAQYDPTTKEITVYNSAFLASGDVDKGVLAHEIQHAKFHQFVEKANSENRQLREDRAKRGYIPQSEIQEKYKKGVLLNDILNTRRSKIVEEGGVSGYSKLFWNQYKTTGEPKHLLLAINETLAETVNLKHSNRSVPKFWDDMVEEVNNA